MCIRALVKPTGLLNCGWFICYMCMCVWLCVNTGLFEVSCKVSDHYMGGMRQQYRVKNCGQNLSALPSAPTAHYYISAEELEWDYSPNRTWELQNFNTTEENRYTQSSSIPGHKCFSELNNRIAVPYKMSLDSRKWNKSTHRNSYSLNMHSLIFLVYWYGVTWMWISETREALII